jgi:hypothetical protein
MLWEVAMRRPLAATALVALGLACGGGAPEVEAPEPEPLVDEAPPAHACVGTWSGTLRGYTGDAFTAAATLTVHPPTEPSIDDIEGGACGELSEDWGRDGTCKARLRRCYVGEGVVARIAPFAVQDCDPSNLDLVCAGDELTYRRKEGRFWIRGTLRRIPEPAP